jgi:molecular chaperone DnaK (HSP70)
MAIAIDFGTSNTVVARWNAATQAPETLSIADLCRAVGDNPPLIPSLVYVKDAAQDHALVGQPVRDRGLDLSQDPRFFRNFKRGIGTPIQGFMPELDGRSVTFEQVGEWFLRQVIQQVRTTEAEVDSLIFTVPVDSFEAYRHWLGSLCQSLDVAQVRMLDEPTAAALGYGLTEQDTVLVIDFGGGTLDLSLVRLDAMQSQSRQRPLGFILKWGKQVMAENSAQKPKTARVLAKAGQNLGGADIDSWLIDEFAEQQGLPISPLTLRLAERLKIQLSTQSEATEVYFNDETLESYELSLTRDRFERILRDRGFFERLDESMTQVLQQSQRQGLTADDVEAVLLVGGTAQIPAVQTWVEDYFERDRIRRQKPFEAISHGALQLEQGIEIKDFLYHSYGIRYWNRRNQRHDWHPIINQGQPYPMPEAAELVLGASVENQPSIELIIGELGEASSSTEVFFDGDRLVTRAVSGGQAQVQPLNDKEGARSIAQLNPPGFPGSDRVKVQFQVDAQRFLRITVEDLLTSETLLDNQIVVRLS